jgi:hypothetical protein
MINTMTKEFELKRLSLKRFNDINDKEFSKLVKNARKQELSPFAKFCQNLKGYKFEDKKGNEVFKYELFNTGYTNYLKLIKGEYPVKAIKIV